MEPVIGRCLRTPGPMSPFHLRFSIPTFDIHLTTSFSFAKQPILGSMRSAFQDSDGQPMLGVVTILPMSEPIIEGDQFQFDTLLIF